MKYDFNTLFQKSITAQKYQIETKRYIEENPDFSDPPNYLDSIIESIPLSQCIDNIIDNSKSSIILLTIQNPQ